MEPNCNLSPQVTHQPSLLGGAENMKLLFDDTMSDISNSRKEHLARQRAYEDLNLRRAQNAATFDHFVAMAAAAAGQTGVTENQSPTSPIRTAAADTEIQQPAGSVYPPIRNVDQSSATANGAVQASIAQITANVAALSDVVTKLAESVSAVLVSAAGAASQPKP